MTGLNDHSSVVGDFIGLAVNAGDTIVFYNNVLTSGDTWSSIVAQNWDGMNHVYSVAYTSGETLNNIATTPNSLNVSGTYVAFEDLSRYSSDLNYHDDTFVFTNVSTNGVPGADVPEPASITLLATGLLGFGVSRRKKNQA